MSAPYPQAICNGVYAAERVPKEVIMKVKLKTKRGAAKRFKKTANGFKRKQAFKRHILTKKSRETYSPAARLCHGSRQ
jgi:hypothetical protein